MRSHLRSRVNCSITMQLSAKNISVYTMKQASFLPPGFVNASIFTQRRKEDAKAQIGILFLRLGVLLSAFA